MIGKALIDLADIANCISGDFHVLHLNMKGNEFDTMHKKVLRKYYEQAANDYDSWAEAALMFDDVEVVPNPNESANRIEWKSCSSIVADKSFAVSRIDTMLKTYLEACVIIFNKLSSNISCYKSIGVANTLQTRIEYWSKEIAYFNARRFS